jgi:penicillin-binding protein-related factor A (putative recombinase)
MQTLLIRNGIMHIAESKAVCPYCGWKIPIEDLESRNKIDKPYFRMKCKCDRFIGIAGDMRGDYVAFDLKKKKIR